MPVTHAKVSAKSDGGDATKVLPSEWNADHVVTGPISSAMSLIAKTVLTSDTASFSFMSIPATYDHLRLIIYGRCSGSVFDGNVGLRFNADTGNNYDRVADIDGTHGAETFAASSGYVGTVVGASGPANIPGVLVIDIPGYALATFQKAALFSGGEVGTSAGNDRLNFGVVNWRSTAAITQIDLILQTGTNFLTGSAVYLYGIGSAASIVGTTALAADTVGLSGGDQSITSGTFGDVTGLTRTLVTGAHRVAVGFIGTLVAPTGSRMYVDIAVDGTRMSGSARGFWETNTDALEIPIGGVVLTDVLTAGSHTFTVQAKVTGGTGFFEMGTTNSSAERFWAVELPDYQPTPPGTLLGIKKYTGGWSYTNGSGTYTDIDATNAAVTFVAPSSGNVLIKYGAPIAWSAAVSQESWAVRDGSTTKGEYLGINAGIDNIWMHPVFYVTGLTPGTSYTYKAAVKVAAGGGTINVYNGTTQPFIMEVWAA